MLKNNDRRPETVQKALMILYITLGIAVLQLIMEYPRIVEQTAIVGGLQFVILIFTITFVLLWLNIFLIGKRQSWARYLLVIIYILGLPSSINLLIDSLIAEPISGLLKIFLYVAQAIAIVLLFRAPSRAWFKKKVQ
jgi:hypothetical protein